MTNRSEDTALERLKAIDWSFSQSTARDLTHGLHPWPAKFIPQIPRAVIEACSEPGDRVLDPFAGCGTTAVEAIRLGREPIAADVNPLAALITRAKCRPPNAEIRARIVSWAEELAVVTPSEVVAEYIPPIPNIDYWFDDDVIAQLTVLRGAIESFGGPRDFLDAVFSSIILAVSHQESETRYRRVEREISADDVLDRFRHRLTKSLAMAADFEDAVGGVDIPASIECRDAREWSSGDQLCDCAVFSPPYPNSFDYHLYHRFRMFWLGFDPRVVKHQEIGAHLRYLDESVWRSDMRSSMENVSSGMRSGALCVVIVGDGMIAGQIVPSSEILSEEAKSLGLNLEADWKRPIATHKKSFNLSDSRLRAEHVLVFRT